GTGLDPLDRTQCYCRAGRVRLHATVIATFALATVCLDGHMTDLAGRIARTVEDLAVQHESAADPGTERQADQRVDVPPRAQPPLTIRRAVRIVVQRRRQTDRVRDEVAQREVAPPEVRRVDDGASSAVQRPR